MKIIIAGSRSMPFIHYPLIDQAVNLIKSVMPITRVGCGLARGADIFGKKWAYANNIPVDEFPADWDKYKIKAGFIRNEQMRDWADGLLAFHYSHSRGTEHMIRIMQEVNKPCYIIYNGVVV